MEPLDKISLWIDAGEPLVLIAVGTLVAMCFVVFNTLRILLYVPQLLTCLRDDAGCPTINLGTWCSWIIANASTGLYMWLFQGDIWGLVLNLGNAAMCAATVGVTVVKRQGHRFANGRCQSWRLGGDGRISWNEEKHDACESSRRPLA